MNSAEKEEVARRLRERGATKPCARCGKEEFVILNRVDLSSFENASKVSGRYYAKPMAVVACENCGHVILHALGLLGFPLEFGESKNVG